MSMDGRSLVERLNLQTKEINCLKGKLQLRGSKDYVSSPSEHNLRLKLRLEARRRMLKHKLESLPSGEDIEMFCTGLRNNATTQREEDKFIDYFTFKRAVDGAPKILRDFLSAKSFMDLLERSDAREDGLVPVNSIVDYLTIKKDKLSKMINLHYYDSAGKGYLSVEDLRDYLENEVLPNIPSLANLNDEETMLQDYYLCIATRKFFFLLDTVRQKKIRITDIVASRLLEEFEALNEPSDESVGDAGVEIEQGTSQTGDALNWFSKENCIRIKDWYRQLDTDANGLLSLSEMTDFQRVTNSFMQRVFEVQQTYDNDELDLRGFCDFILAMENKSDCSALRYYFQVMDVDGDNLLNASDLNFFYRDLAKMLEDCFPEDSLQKAPPFEDVKDEIFDMCRAKDPRGITLKELISSGKGGTVVGMLTDLDAFLEYENREDVIYEE